MTAGAPGHQRADQPDPVQRAAQALRLGGWVAIAALAFARALVSLYPMPYWDIDPSRTPAFGSGLGPGGSLTLDVLTLLAAAAALTGEVLAGRRVVWCLAGLIGVGGLGVAIHGLGGGVSLEDLRIGSSWLAAMVTGLAIFHLAREEKLARLTFAVAISMIAMLAAKGALQVFVEHPATVAEFQRNREGILAAHGWSPDSAMARGFERRLIQAEASGWFGLANVFASLAAACCVGLLGLTVDSWRAARPRIQAVPDGIAGVATLGLIMALASVWMAGSKAGWAVIVIGAGLIVFGWLAGSRGEESGLRRLGPIVAVGAVVLAVLGVVLGHAVGDLSLVFRWFYMRGAAQVIAEHPLLGVGPAGFKDAYMIAKPAIAPESVDSPHNVVLDYLATLGVLGAAWLGVLGVWLWHAGKLLTVPTIPPGVHAPGWRSRTARARAAGSHGEPESGVTRAELWLMVAAAGIPTAISAWAEAAQATPESALVRLAGLGVWVAMAVSCLTVMRAAPAWGRYLGAAAVVLAVHMQVEVTPVWPGAASWVMLMLAAAAGRASATIGEAPPPVPVRHRPEARAFVVPAALAVVAVVLAATGAVPARAWEQSLRRGAESLRPLASVRERLDALARGRPRPGDSVAQVTAQIGDLLGAPAPHDDESLARAGAELTVRSGLRADAELGDALEIFPHHPPTARAASKLWLDMAAAYRELGEPERAREAGDRAEDLARRPLDGPRERAADWGWLGTLRKARYELEQDRLHLRRAVEAWEQAERRDPHGVLFPLELTDAYRQLGDLERSAAWARAALERHERLRLDPAVRLTDDQLARARAAAGGS